ncbi:MAG: (d)CMP kinase [Thermomicrobiales bacterium]
MIAIDGPAAAGKTTVARAVADRLGATLFDTGILYRTVTLAAIRRGIADTAHGLLADLAGAIEIAVRPPSVADGRFYDVLLDGNDVTWAIREKPVEARVSAVSAVPEVRAALLPVQRRIAAGDQVVMVGRDVGSVVLPEAGLKIFLDASDEERARRRARELEARGTPVDSGAILAAMRARDAYDSSRAVAPLRAADDAVVIATDHRTVESIVDEILTVAVARGIAAPEKA